MADDFTEDELSKLTKFVAVIRDQDLDFWVNNDGTPYASFKHRNKWKNTAIESMVFQAYLADLYEKHTRQIINPNLLTAAVGWCKREGVSNGKHKDIAPRVRQQDGKIYIDLGGDDWNCVEVSKDGWRLIDRVPAGVPLVRTNMVAPFPIPRTGGSIHRLKDFINYSTEENWVLLVGFILSCFRQAKEYPILAVSGAQGSAKTTLTDIISKVIDPQNGPPMQLQDQLRDFTTVAKNKWLLAFDNLSGISKKVSDALCRISTGLTVSERMLYTNAETASYSIYRPVIFNGIPELSERDDLGRRMFQITLSPIKDNMKVPPDIIVERFEQEWPEIFGAILDLLVDCLSNYYNQELPQGEGLPSVIMWVEGAAKQLGWEKGHFTRIYQGQRHEMMESMIENNPFALAVEAIAKEHKEVQCDYDQFLKHAMKYRSTTEDYFPQKPRTWIEALRRSQPALRALNVEVVGLDKMWKSVENRRRIVKLKYVGDVE